MPVTQVAAADIPSGPETIARARALIPALAARAPDGERERCIAAQTVAEMQAAGLFRVLQPKRWGGYELDILTYYEIEMALAEGDMSVAWVYGVVGIHPWLIALYDDRAARDIWGADDTTLVCSSLMPVGTATPVDGGFRLSGRWKYASGCEHCAWAFLGGAPPGGSTVEERRILLVPKSDYEIVDTWHVSGLKATGSHDIVVEDAFVPAYRTVTFADNFRGVAPGLAVNTAPLYRLPFGQVFFRGVSTAAIGALQGMLNAYIDYGKAHRAPDGRAGVGGRADPAHLRGSSLRHRRDEDHPAPQFHGPRRLRRARRDAADEAAHGVQVPQRLGGRAVQPARGAAVQGHRLRRHFRRPALRPHPRRHQRRALAHFQPIRGQRQELRRRAVRHRGDEGPGALEADSRSFRDIARSAYRIRAEIAARAALDSGLAALRSLRELRRAPRNDRREAAANLLWCRAPTRPRE
jgi:alkylation response protein AidB-like acyl-CoA dehydrogenase